MTSSQPTGPRWQSPEPPRVNDVVIVVAIGSVAFWALILSTTLFRSAPSTAPLGAIIFGLPLLFFNAMIAVVVVEAVWLQRTDEYNQRVAQLKTLRANGELAERRRQEQRAAAEADRRAQIARTAQIRDDIAKTEQRIRTLEAEHAAADIKIKEAS